MSCHVLLLVYKHLSGMDKKDMGGRNQSVNKKERGNGAERNEGDGCGWAGGLPVILSRKMVAHSAMPHSLPRKWYSTDLS